MANTISGENGKTEMNTNRDEVSSARLRTAQMKDKVSDKTRDKFEEASEMATEYYNRASHWLEGNYGKAVGAVAVITAVGFLGFYLGKSSRVHMPELRDL
jgi:hypothetical protein